MQETASRPGPERTSRLEKQKSELSKICETAPGHIQYTNAKVLLVGESGAGKTGLSRRLVFDDWQPTDSTVGAWATQWKLPVNSSEGVEREIWLWDFGGQADQRLIHQLYMDETALAVLVFDGQKEDLFETLGQWDRDLTRASRQAFSKLLVAGRVDTGGLRVSRTQLEAFKNER
ncbi:MAG TPA: ADP-ribosylation factor-like protein, partial [Blastocatellia bacterium]|nr:ADP-ribosylation factor-like protein [Blastocatellia bacterium]